MRIVSVNVFKFEELSDKSKEVARQWWTSSDPCDYIHQEFRQQLCKLEKEFNFSVFNWEYDASSYRFNLSDDDFMPASVVGITPERIDDAECYENVFLKTLHATSDLRESVKALFQSVVDECSYQYTNECIDESIIANEYEFLENGERCAF